MRRTILSIFCVLFFLSITAVAAPVTINVQQTSYQYWTNEQYPLINLFGEKYVPLEMLDWADPKESLKRIDLAKLLIDDNKHVYTITHSDKNPSADQVLKIGSYTIFVLNRFGSDKLVFGVTDSTSYWDMSNPVAAGDTCIMDPELKKDQHSDDYIVARTRMHIKSISYDAASDTSTVTIDGIWLADFMNPLSVTVGDQIKGYTVTDTGWVQDKFGSNIFSSTSITLDVNVDQKLQQMKTTVQGFVSSGKLNQRQANILLVTLDAVKFSLKNGKNNLAIDELKAFIIEVNTYIRNKLLTSQDGQTLTELANDIILALKYLY